MTHAAGTLAGVGDAGISAEGFCHRVTFEAVNLP